MSRTLRMGMGSAPHIMRGAYAVRRIIVDEIPWPVRKRGVLFAFDGSTEEVSGSIVPIEPYRIVLFKNLHQASPFSSSARAVAPGRHFQYARGWNKHTPGLCNETDRSIYGDLGWTFSLLVLPLKAFHDGKNDRQRWAKGRCSRLDFRTTSPTGTRSPAHPGGPADPQDNEPAASAGRCQFPGRSAVGMSAALPFTDGGALQGRRYDIPGRWRTCGLAGAIYLSAWVNR